MAVWKTCRILLTLACIHTCLLSGGALSDSTDHSSRFASESPAQLDVLYKYSTKQPIDTGKRRLRLYRRDADSADNLAFLGESSAETKSTHPRTERSPRLRFLKRDAEGEMDAFQDDSREEAYAREQRSPRLRFIKRDVDDRYDGLREVSGHEAYLRETREPRLRFLKRDAENVDRELLNDDVTQAYLPSRESRAPRLRFVKRSAEVQQHQDLSAQSIMRRSFFDSNFEFLYRSFLMDKQRRLNNLLLERISEIGKRASTFSDDSSTDKRAVASTALWSLLHDVRQNAEYDQRHKIMSELGLTKRSFNNALWSILHDADTNANHDRRLKMMSQLGKRSDSNE